MNRKQQLEAKKLYFQANLTKTQIAEVLGIPRRTLHYWIKQNDWDRLKTSAEYLPTLIAENCYYVIAQFTKSLMSEGRIMRPVTRHEAETLHMLTLSVNKLKKGATLNENMETFAYFLDRVNKRSPALAKEIAPIVEDYIKTQANVYISDFWPADFNSMGYLRIKKEDITEEKLDIQDIHAWTDGPTADEIYYMHYPNEKPPENKQQITNPECHEEITKPTHQKTHVTSPSPLGVPNG